MYIYMLFDNEKTAFAPKKSMKVMQEQYISI